MHCIIFSCHYLDVSGLGNFARLLPSLEVAAVSQAPSPGSTPTSLLHVTAMAGQHPTIES